jgi:hypothetical protein
MKYPQRVQQHIAESQSLKNLSDVLPDRWIVRQVTERDYGIDLYLEIIDPELLVTGKMLLMQVKGKDSLTVHDDCVLVGGIEESTCKYWHSLPIPVFLVAVDLSAKKPYWFCASWELRFNHDYKGAETRSFRIPADQIFDGNGLYWFERAYNRERQWPEIENGIANAILSYQTLGPLVLHCIRMADNEPISSPVHALLTQHYRTFEILIRFLTNEFKSKLLCHWSAGSGCV